MKINPDSPDFRSRIDSTAAPSKGTGSFGETLASKVQSGAAAQPLADLAQGLTKTDLSDPAKADASVHQAVHEIIDKEFSGMCAPDREKLAAWLGSDPMMREAILRRLTSLAP